MQMEADFAKDDRHKENLNDPATAINNVMEEYKKTWHSIFMHDSNNQDFKSSRIGLSLPDYLTKWHRVFRRVLHTSNTKKLRKGSLDIQKIQLQAQISERADIRKLKQQIQLAKMQGDITRANYLWQIQNDPENKQNFWNTTKRQNEK